MDEETVKIASYYDQLGRELFKAANDMGDADAEYGVGSKLKGGFMNLVQKLMAKAKSLRKKPAAVSEAAAAPPKAVK